MPKHAIVRCFATVLVMWAAGCAAPSNDAVAPSRPNAPPTVADVVPAAVTDDSPVAPPTPQKADSVARPHVVAYYFHRTLRCPSCLKIEDYATHAVQAMFPQEIADGVVEWRTLNMEQPENAGFVKDFQVDVPSLVLDRLQGGKRLQWKNLTKVWDLLDNQGAFTVYVHQEVERMLGEPSPGSH